MSPTDQSALYKRAVERITANWQPFQHRRSEYLAQEGKSGQPAEKVAENIVQHLLTEVLDWHVAGISYQVERADLVVSDLGIKRLLVETKRPGLLAWSRREIDKALDQARGYAYEQRLTRIAISDGLMFYAADLDGGNLRDRLFVPLNVPKPQELLWLVSMHGIYADATAFPARGIELLPRGDDHATVSALPGIDDLIHPKYQLPARCFAYVGNPSQTTTWSLPYLLADGSPDAKRLPMAVGSIIRTYRGQRVRKIPAKDIPDVLVRLAHAAVELGKMPFQMDRTTPMYEDLQDALYQLNRLEEIKGSAKAR